MTRGRQPVGARPRGPGARGARRRAAVPARRHRRRRSPRRVPLAGLAVGGGVLAWPPALRTSSRTARPPAPPAASAPVTGPARSPRASRRPGSRCCSAWSSSPSSRCCAGPLTRALAGGAGPVAAAAERGCASPASARRCCWSPRPATAGCAGCSSRRPLRYVARRHTASALCSARCSSTRRPRARRLGHRQRGRADGRGGAVRAGAAAGAGAAAPTAGAPARPARGRPRPAAARRGPPAVLPGRGRRGRPPRRRAARRAPDRAAALALPRPGARRVAIAAQSLVGDALGAGRPADARRQPAGSPVGAWARGRGRRLLLACAPVLLPLFSADPAVHAQAAVVWWFLAACSRWPASSSPSTASSSARGTSATCATSPWSRPFGFLPLCCCRAAGLGLGGVWAGLDAVHRAPAGRGAGAVRGRWLVAAAGADATWTADPPGRRGTPTGRARRRLVVVDKPGGHDLARRGGPGAPAARYPPGRARRHPRPDGHRRPHPRRRAGDPAAHLRDRARKEYRRPSGWASPPSPTTREGEVVAPTDAGHLDEAGPTALAALTGR